MSIVRVQVVSVLLSKLQLTHQLVDDLDNLVAQVFLSLLVFAKFGARKDLLVRMIVQTCFPESRPQLCRLQILLGEFDLLVRHVRDILHFQQLKEFGNSICLLLPEFIDLGDARLSQFRLFSRSLRILDAQARLGDLIHVLHHQLVPLVLVERLWLQRLEQTKAVEVVFLRFLIVAYALVVDAAKVCRDNRLDLWVHLMN